MALLPIRTTDRRTRRAQSPAPSKMRSSSLQTSIINPWTNSSNSKHKCAVKCNLMANMASRPTCQQKWCRKFTCSKTIVTMTRERQQHAAMYLVLAAFKVINNDTHVSNNSMVTKLDMTTSHNLRWMLSAPKRPVMKTALTLRVLKTKMKWIKHQKLRVVAGSQPAKNAEEVHQSSEVNPETVRRASVSLGKVA